MAKQLQLRRGTTTQHASFTGVVGEVTVDTDKDTAVVHDGSTAGGVPLATEGWLSSKSHIIPNVLYPAVAGKLSDGTTSHGATYGVAQGDGRSYYYTDIKGSKPIKDPRIGAHFGSQRHKFKSIQLLEQETATHGKNVYSIDGRNWCRVVGNWIAENGSDSTYLHSPALSDAPLEITGYFNDINFLNKSFASRYDDIDITVNGAV
jgi:hypothetical protein